MRRKLINSIWSILEYIWNPLLAIIATPFFFKHLGSDKYGLWMLFFTTVNLGAILNTGTGAATIKRISQEIGAKQFDRIQSVIGGSLAIAILGGGLLASVIFTLFWFGGDTFFLKMGDVSSIRMTGVAAALLGWLEQIDNVFASTLKGAERYGIAARLEMVSKSGQIIFSAFVLSFVGGLEALYLAVTATTLIRLLAKIAFSRNIFPEISLRLNAASAKSLIEFSKWGWLHGVGGLFFNIMDRFFIGSMLGAASLTVYSIATQLAVQIHGLASAAISVVFPMISRMRANDPSIPLYKTMGIVLLANLIISSSIALVLIIFGKSILTLWLGGDEGLEVAKLLPYLAVAYWALAVSITAHFFLLGLGRIRFLAYSNSAAGTVSLALMWWQIQVHGLIGVAEARLAYGLIILLNFLPLLKELRGRDVEKTKIA